MRCYSPLEITQCFIRTHMEQRNLEDALACLTNAVTWFGTGAFEVVRGKNAARRFLFEEISALPAGYTVAFEDMTQTMLTEDSGTVFGRMLVTDHMMGSQLDCRVTTACVRQDGCFLIASLHMSLPTTLQKGSEYYPLTIATQKIQQLKDNFFNTALPGGLICCDVNEGFRVRYVNDFFAQLLGYQSKEDYLSAVGGLFVNCLGAGEDIAGMAHDVQAMKIGGHHTFTYRVKKKGGAELWFRGYTYKYEDCARAALLCFCMDISDIIQLENELKEQTTRLEFASAEMQTIISNIPGGVHRCPLFGRIHVNYVSQGFEELAGYTQAEIHSLFCDNYTMLLIEEDRSVFSTAMRRLAVEPASCILKYRMRRKDGGIIRVADHFRSVRMEDGNIWGFGVATDVTAQHETLAQLQLLTDSIPGGLVVYEYSAKGLATLYFSDGVCAMVGYTRPEYEQIAKTNILGFTFQEDLALLRPKIACVLAGENTLDCVYRHRTKSGGYRWLNLRGTVADRLGDVLRVNAVLLDITEAKESEEKLRIRDQEYSLAIKQSGKVVYRYNVADKSAYLLQKAADSFGFPASASNVPESIVALNLFAPESVDDLIAFYAAIANGKKTGCVTLRRKLKNGDFGWCRAHFTTLFSSIGKPVSAVISIEDITKQHEQELENEILRQNEELFQVVLSHSDRFIVKFDVKTHTAYVQPRTASAFCIGEIVHNVPYQCVKKEGIYEESVQAYIDFYEKLIRGEPSATAIVKMRRNGHLDQWGWYRFDGSVIFDDKKQPSYAVVSFLEVTKQYEKELAYQRLNRHIEHLSKDALLYFETNLTEMKIEHASGCWLCHMEQILEANPAALLQASIHRLVHPDDCEAVTRFFDRDSLLASFAAGKTEKEMEARILKNKEPNWVSITLEMVLDPYTENVLVYVLFLNIHKIKTKAIRILKQAETDGLTELSNRSAMEQEIKHLLESRQDTVYAFVVVDIDDLKVVNDALGHLQGDRAIRAFANTLRGCFGSDTLVGRIGGDEFVVFLKDVASEANLTGTMHTLVDKLSALRVGEKDEHALHGSIGIVVSTCEQESFESLYKKADIALYYVKRHGKNNYAFYRTTMEGAEHLPEEQSKG